MNENGSLEEIEEAKTNLEEAKVVNQDLLSTWLHPSETLQKLSEILEQQMKDQDEDYILQITQNFINHDAEESLQMIKSDQEEAYFFKFIEESSTKITTLKMIIAIQKQLSPVKNISINFQISNLKSYKKWIMSMNTFINLFNNMK